MKVSRGISCYEANSTVKVVEAPTILLSGVSMNLLIRPLVAMIRISYDVVSYSFSEDKIANILLSYRFYANYKKS